MAADEDFWDDLLGHLKQGLLVPVVGPDVVIGADDGRQVTLSRFIGQRLAERYNLSLPWTEYSGLDDAVRAYVTANGKDKAERLYRVINDILADVQWPVPEPLERLARISDLRLFVSTSFDSFLARALDHVRFGGAHLTRELWFSPNQSTAIQQKNATPPSEASTVVFKLFGEASSTPQYALHDEDMLEWVHALLTEAAPLPEWLGHQLKHQPLLFIGCRISDWMGRFLIRLSSANRLSMASKQVFIVGGDTKRHPQMTEFFATYCGTTRVQIVDADPAEFTTELLRRWTKRNPQPSTVEGHPTPDLASAGHGTIFISYVREDAVPARRVADAIASLGGDVWLDERRLQPGDRWQDGILTSIRREIRLFIPLISRHTEARDEGYIFKEWLEAVERARGIPRRRFIVPIVLDAEYAGNPAAYRQIPGEFTAFHFGRAPAGEADADLLATLNEEIRAMRRKDAA